MLTTVTVVPPAGAFWPSFELPVLAPGSGGLFIEKVEGLEPVAATINTNSYNELDGEFYVGSKTGKRNIILHCLFEPNFGQTISDLRRQLYGYFMPKLPVNLQFSFTDRDPVMISGYVEDYQGDRFSSDPDAQISIVCPMPNFVLVEPVVITGNSEVGTNPPFTDVLNPGDQAIGMTLRLVNNSGDDFEGDVIIDRKIESSPGVYYSVQQMYFVDIPVDDSASDGAYVLIDTNPGEKSVGMKWSDGFQNLLGNMHDDSSWINFWPGTAKFRVITTGTTGWGTNHLNWILTLNPQFGGV